MARLGRWGGRGECSWEGVYTAVTSRGFKGGAGEPVADRWGILQL